MLVHRVQKKSYIKLTIGVETGYNMDFYAIRIYHDCPEISVGDQVSFNGWKFHHQRLVSSLSHYYHITGGRSKSWNN